jgi:hypothetical protein
MNTPKIREETPVNLGDLINLFYQEYMALYGDEELASVAAAATINEMLSETINDNSVATEKEEVEAA